jgi:hypothetical protein
VSVSRGALVGADRNCCGHLDIEAWIAERRAADGLTGEAAAGDSY